MTDDQHSRVFILCPFFSPNIGGVETHLDDLCAYLAGRGYHVSVLTYQPLTTRARGAALERRPNLVIHRLRWPGYNLFHRLEPYPLVEFFYITPRLMLGALRFMVACGRQVGVIHAHGLNAAFIAKFLKRLFKRRLVTSIHAVYNLTSGSRLGRAVRWTLSSSDAVLTLSHQSRAELIALGLPEARVKVCTYWVDQEKFRPIQATEHRKQMGWEGRFVVLFVGRLIAIKGIELLLKVAERSDERFLFVFAGDGPMSTKIQEAASRRPNVCFLGGVDNRDLPRYYNGADVLAVPSHYEEGFGRVIVEALSCGLPVIGSRRGGIPEAIDDTVGVLVEPTVDAFQTAIVSLYQEPARLEQLRRNCRAFAERRYSDRNGQIVLDAYRSDVMSPQSPR